MILPIPLLENLKDIVVESYLINLSFVVLCSIYRESIFHYVEAKSTDLCVPIMAAEQEKKKAQ